MFRKFLDKLKNTKLDTFQKTTQTEAKKFIFTAKEYQNKLKKDLEKNWDTKKLYENFPSAKVTWEKISKNLNFKQLEENYSKKRDKITENIESKAKKATESLKKMGKESTNVPKVVKSGMTDFLKDTKSFFEESFTMSKNHISNYMKGNDKYFKYKFGQASGFFDKSKRKLLLIGAGIVFIYAVGANIPHAIVVYKLSNEAIKRAEKVRDEVYNEKQIKNQSDVITSVAVQEKVEKSNEKEKIFEELRNDMEKIRQDSDNLLKAE
ncbi:hypothetical protein SteCoe_7211 [Stentor coeruleus]|uniref:Uncharacterized protein n=1 Tax=Stentor coeruleus TaxID=5963 RepID=A0A1R2CN65_9CILI|nr:hypothetical protein SteCoe_7211 [Stentor coeruleus]